MNLILIGFLILIFFYVFINLGFFFNHKLLVINKNNLIDLIILGYAIFILISFHSYFFLNLKIEYFISLIILFFLYSHLKFTNFLKKNLKLLIKYSLIIFCFILIFYLPIKIYGEQFYVFRGNYWDNFNYLSSALLFSEYNYSNLKSLNLAENFKNFQSIESIIIYRPYISYLLSLFLKLKIADIFLVNFVFKIFLSVINLMAFISFLQIFKKLSENKRILLSFILSFSFFSLYIFEIEALSHLGSISLFLISIKYLYLLSLRSDDKNFNNQIFICILSAALFIVYPEIFIIFGIISISYLISKINYSNYKIFFKNIFLCFLIFTFFTIASYIVNYKFLIMQISQALNPGIDWWTYFGAFILGRDNLVLDAEYIKLIDENIVNKNIFDLIKMFYLDHLKQGYNYIFINIIPSLFGVYYLTEGKIISITSYFICLITLLLNFYIISIIINNIKFVLKNKIKILYASVLLILLLIFYLIFKANFWTVIKIYSYCFVFIFILVSINFKNQTLNKSMIALLLIFPIYKYSTFNYGIGVADSFPSIINKEYKKKINWNLNKKNLDFCENIYTLESDYFVRAYINIKSLYNNKNFVNSIDEKNKNKYCEVSVRNKSFVVISHK